nr:reverse transcriptase domain-containing protein [Tanacetum cinerariifolium]
LVPTPAWTDSEVIRLLAISSPPASPLSLWSLPPSQIPFPPLPPILSPPSLGAPVSTDTELGGYVREFETRVRQDTYEIYMRLDDEQTKRQLLAGRLNMLFRDRRAHAYTRQLIETEARMSREAWVRAIDASDLVHGEVMDRRAHAYTRQLMETEARMSREAWVLATDASDLIHGEVMSLRTTVLGQMLEIRELQDTDRRRQTVISELLRIDHRRSTEILELRTALQGQGLAEDPTQPGLPDEAGGRVTAALAACDALRSTNGDDSHNSGTGVRRMERAARECTYTDFLKCQPLPFKGTEGVASLSQWCERMESVFHISNCTAENQVKFATCTIHYVALTRWNIHVQTVGHEVAYGMSWKTLMKMRTDKYCPRNEIRKLEIEL